MTMSAPRFDGIDDYFDSRDVISRLEEIDDEIAQMKAWIKESTDDDPSQYIDDLAELKAERKALRKLRDEASDGTIPDWEYGETFFHEDYFEEAMREQVKEDSCYLPNDLVWWIEDAIDWEKVADVLRQDYTEFSFRDATYLAR